MSKDTTTTTDNTSSSATRPWDESMPLINKLFSGLQGYNANATPGQTGAGADLVSAAKSIPNLSGTYVDAVKSLFNTSTQPQQDMLTGGYADLKKNLGGYLDPSYLDPTSTPGFSDAWNTLKEDITNSVNSQFAAAGRDLSPGNSTALGRGLIQGGGGLLQDQYNKNVTNQQNAAKSIFDAAGTTANGVASLGQIPLANSISGLQAAGGLGGLLTQPAATTLAAENTAAGIPLSNYAGLEQLGLPLAGLGSNSTGTSHSTSTVEQPLGPQIVGGLLGGAGLAAKLGGGFGGLGGLLGGGSGFIGNPWGSSGIGGVPRAGLDF